MARPRKATEEKAAHDTPYFVPTYETRPLAAEAKPKTNDWKKEAIVLKTMYHRFGLPGRVGDKVLINPDMYDLLVNEKFIK